jgi:transposase
VRGRKAKIPKSLYECDFLNLIKHEQSAEVRVRLLALQHVKDGKRIREAGRMVKKHEKSLRNWITKFEKEGINGLRNNTGRGRKRKLPSEKLNQLKKEVISLQENRSGGRIRGKDVMEVMKEKFNIVCSLSVVYRALHSAGMTWISARSKHPKSNLFAQEDFKKNLCQR